MTSDSHKRMACINEGIRRPGAGKTHLNGRLMTPSTTFPRHWKAYEEARRPIVEKLLGAADSCSMVRKLSSAYGTLPVTPAILGPDNPAQGLERVASGISLSSNELRCSQSGTQLEI